MLLEKLKKIKVGYSKPFSMNLKYGKFAKLPKPSSYVNTFNTLILFLSREVFRERKKKKKIKNAPLSVKVFLTFVF